MATNLGSYWLPLATGLVLPVATLIYTWWNARTKIRQDGSQGDRKLDLDTLALLNTSEANFRQAILQDNKELRERLDKEAELRRQCEAQRVELERRVAALEAVAGRDAKIITP